MDAGVAPLPSILNKPLTQLTEEDVSQLTREDCRRYLKEKGMRRPSWNKSQAIQQVISLKALLETSADSGAGDFRSILISKSQTSPSQSPSPSPSLALATLNSCDSVNDASGEADNNIASDSVEGIVPGRVNDSSISAQLDSQAEEADYDVFASRSPGAAHGTIGQLTIFYSGKVNVYDGVPPDKARAIMHLAASPIRVSLDDTISRTTALPFPFHLRTPGNKPILIRSGATISPASQSENRTECLQQCQERGNMTHDHGNNLGLDYWYLGIFKFFFILSKWFKSDRSEKANIIQKRVFLCNKLPSFSRAIRMNFFINCGLVIANKSQTTFYLCISFISGIAGL